jgi:uroporphyrinogen decarboxylase
MNMNTMTSRQRMLTAIQRGVPDRLPVTTHHVMEYFLEKYMGGISSQEFFEYFGLDAIQWIDPRRPDTDAGQYMTNEQLIVTDDWRIKVEDIPDPQYKTMRYHIYTPKGSLTTVLQSNVHTTWVAEHLIKNPEDIDILAAYLPAVQCDVRAANRAVEAYGERGITRGTIPGEQIFGQPGCWQDAACLVGIEKLIYATFDDPEWVHALLKILQERKAAYIRSLKGAKFDLLELGGGDASTTVISPKTFRKFVAPYDSELIRLAHEMGQQIVYHTCGGMMPILEDIADMGPDAMETFTPPDMGADVDLAEAKRRIGDRVCMIGGFDQAHDLFNCSEQQTRAAVRRCFDQAGLGGGFILSPSDHFFDAEPKLIMAFADEAHKCSYSTNA